VVCPTGAIVERDDTDAVWAALEDETKHVVVQEAPAIRAQLAEPPSGISAYLTGDGPILDAYSSATLKSMDSVTLITIILVIIILVLIYRSPVSPIIPLATIGLAYLLSRAVVAFLGAGPLTISMYTNVFLIVILFGAGTDYCLFLISRFREEMADARSPAPAVKTTVRAVGETIASSAGTVIVGLAMMVFSELGLYNTTGPVPEGEYLVPIGVADVKRAGEDVTIVATSRMVHLALEAAERLSAQGIEAEVVDPRTLKPLDLDTIVRSVQKTGRLVVVNEAHLTGGFTAEVAARVQRQAFDWLDAPIMQVATEDVPLPYSGPLELEALPTVEDIVRAVRETLP